MALNSLQSLPFHCLDDNEFMHIIFEQQHGPIHFDSDRLTSLKYNPLIMDLHKYRRLTLTNDLDPDSNFNVGSNSCNYFVEDEFNSLTCKLLQCFYLPTSEQYGEYVIEFKSFHQNGNISETVA
jgi:hypothetical protein